LRGATAELLDVEGGHLMRATARVDFNTEFTEGAEKRRRSTPPAATRSVDYR